MRKESFEDDRLVQTTDAGRCAKFKQMTECPMVLVVGEAVGATVLSSNVALHLSWSAGCCFFSSSSQDWTAVEDNRNRFGF